MKIEFEEKNPEESKKSEPPTGLCTEGCDPGDCNHCGTGFTKPLKQE